MASKSAVSIWRRQTGWFILGMRPLPQWREVGPASRLHRGRRTDTYVPETLRWVGRLLAGPVLIVSLVLGFNLVTLHFDFIASAGPAEDQGLAIMKEQERVNSGYRDEIGRYKMTLVNANGDRTERIMERRTLEGVKEGDKILVVFQAPPDINGTALLTHQHKAGDDDQWLYLPGLRRIKRIASSTRSNSFVGSEYTYEDLTPLELTKYTFRYLRDETIDGVALWVVETVPRFKDSAYSRSEVFIRKDNHQTIRINFYERKGALLKVGRFDGWTKVDGKWWRARIGRIENAQTKRSTSLETLDLKIGAGLSRGDFTTQALERQ